MNLYKLFETQKVLDAHIEKEHPRVEDENRLAKKLLSLQVELGELANEWRGFKFWSNAQEPRTYGLKLGKTPKENRYINPLLEEYVDCLHFILSIGLENYKYGSSDDHVQLPIGWIRDHSPIKYENVIKQFNYLFNTIGYFMDCTSDCEMGTNSEIEDQYENTYRIFIGLGEMLGFTQEQIEKAYYQKNEVNHERQNTGY